MDDVIRSAGSVVPVKCEPFDTAVVKKSCKASQTGCAFGDDPTNSWTTETLAMDECSKNNVNDVCSVGCLPGWYDRNSLLLIMPISINKHMTV